MSGPLSGDQHDDIDSFPTITLNPNPDGRVTDLNPGSPTPTDSRGVKRGTTSLPKDAGASKSKGGT